MRLLLRIGSPSFPAALLGLLALLPAAGVAARDEPLATVTEQLVVTATLVEEEQADVPATIRVVSREEIDSRQAESVVELLSAVPGVHAATYGSRGQLGSVFVRGADSGQTLVLWNGIPLNDPYFGDFNWAFLPTEGVERVEVASGPFSALYGSSAMGGVVQVITSAERGGRLALEAGERGHRRITANGAVQRGPFQGEGSGHLRRGDGSFANDFYDSDELAGRLGWKPIAALDLGLRARWNESATGVPFVGITPSPLRRIDWEELELALPVTAQVAGWELAAHATHRDSTNRFRDPADPFGFTAGDTESRADRARLVATRPLETLGWWAAGGEWERLEVTDGSTFGPNLDRTRQRTRAVFSQLHLERARWALDAGLRHDDNDVFGGATSPRLGAVVALGGMARARASYGESFRAPSLGELYYPFSGNPQLQPERGRSAEIGLELRRGAWRLDLAAFSNRQRDLIDYDFARNRNHNVGRARSEGFEAELVYRGPRLVVRSGATRASSENEDTGEPLPRRPEHSAFLVASWQQGRLRTTLAGSWVDERPDVDPVTFLPATNPSYSTLEVAMSWRALSWLEPYARVENAFDEVYEPVLGFAAPGRTVVVGARLGR